MKYLTVKDVAEMLGVKQVTVYKWLREEKLIGTFFKIGGVYRFEKEKLERALEGMGRWNANSRNISKEFNG